MVYRMTHAAWQQDDDRPGTVEIDPAAALARELEIDLGKSSLVGVDSSALGSLAAALRDDASFTGVQRFGWDDETYWLVDAPPSDRAQYLAVGNSINFRFWRLHDGAVLAATGARDGSLLQGSMFMWRSLRQCVSDGAIPVLDARFLSRVTADELDQIFRDDSGTNPIPAIAERVANLRNLGDQLADAWGGEFLHLLEASEGRLAQFARYSSRLRAYDDPICKLTMVNAIMQQGSGLVEFDHDPLPGIDYELVRQLLRMSILRPDRQLGDKLRSRALLDPGESAELRRTALAALLQISERSGVPCDVLDNKLWMNRMKCTDAEPVCRQAGRAHECPFVGTCAQITELGMPLEVTRYY
jgi:Potential Queuosine, Q, salvage protein family